jgi:hypothetical protein
MAEAAGKHNTPKSCDSCFGGRKTSAVASDRRREEPEPGAAYRLQSAAANFAGEFVFE